MRTLISVSDKSGIVEFAQGLSHLGFEIVSTAATAATLASHQIAVTNVETVTQFPEMLDGRVKTLHPTLYAGILADRSNHKHIKTCQEHGIVPIDMVVVNLYPFEQTIQRPQCLLNDAIASIDIGGPAMIRAAAKNHASVAVVVCPDRYCDVLDELAHSPVPVLSEATRLALAIEAFSYTAHYDRVIASFLSQRSEKDMRPSTDTHTVTMQKTCDLRYGENPHQHAAFYHTCPVHGMGSIQQQQGKMLSYNNLMDGDTACQVVSAFNQPTAAIIKHATPCGVASCETIEQAYQRARKADTQSAFGSVVGFNRPVDLATAQQIVQTFVEVVMAPSFHQDAMNMLQQKPELRLVSIDTYVPDTWSYRQLSGGFLRQQTDHDWVDPTPLMSVTRAQPTPDQLVDMAFADRVVTYVRSNAIVLAKGQCSVGIGAGQMSRIDAVDIALKKAGDRACGSVMASDAFFPFKDAVERCAHYGISAIIQPGGSKRDSESIDAANQAGIAMIFTKRRHFKH